MCPWALHFIYENKRVQKEVSALKAGNIGAFLDDVKASGNSSFKYLQNVYSNQDIKNQNVSLALFVSEMFLGQWCMQGTWRRFCWNHTGVCEEWIRGELQIRNG